MTSKTISRRNASERAQRVNDVVAESLKAKGRTRDSFQDFALNLGIGTDNPLTGATYGFNPVTLVRTLLEWIHRGSWLGGAAVDIVADDMTRAGIEYHTSLDPDDVENMLAAESRLNLWGSLNSAFKWSRLYGGSLVVMLIDGQNPATPLRLETIGKDQLKGFLVLDRWMVEPSMEKLIATYGPSMGLPVEYRVNTYAPGLALKTIHYSRLMRIEGIELPYWQKLSNNLWGLSVIERLYDRMIAFDSATTGASQSVYKSFLRTLKLDGLREAIMAGGEALAGVSAQVNFMRRFQGIEGISVIDADDEFQIDGATNFAGIAEALGQFGQQISGALQMPLTRLFGQSPSGFSAGDSEIRTYYDGIKHQQEKYREPLTTFLTVMAKSEGVPLPEDFGFEFNSLWQLDEVQKSDIAAKDATTIGGMFDSGIIGRKTALSELRTSSRITGRFTTITDEDIESAEEDPPAASEALPGGEENTGKEASAIPSESAAKEPAKSSSVASTAAKDRARLLDVLGHARPD